MKFFVKRAALILLLVAGAAALSAQTGTKSAASPVAKSASTSKSNSNNTTKSLPGKIPPVQGIIKTVFTVSLRYEEIKLGTGAPAEPHQRYLILYTGYRAADGVKFDSSEDHRVPVKGADGKPVIGDDGKPKLMDAQPMPFVQGTGATVSGFDQGFVGMKVGGKRRLFIPWQMAYATKTIPDRDPEHPGIPAKSDLIFDVELVAVEDTALSKPGTDILEGELSMGYSAAPFSGSMKPSGLSIDSNGKSYAIVIDELTKVPADWDLHSGVLAIEPGRYSVRGRITDNQMKAEEIKYLGK
jgi:peptidylprolyl isomerase